VLREVEEGEGCCVYHHHPGTSGSTPERTEPSLGLGPSSGVLASGAGKDIHDNGEEGRWSDGERGGSEGSGAHDCCRPAGSAGREQQVRTAELHSDERGNGRVGSSRLAHEAGTAPAPALASFGAGSGQGREGGGSPGTPPRSDSPPPSAAAAAAASLDPMSAAAGRWDDPQQRQRQVDDGDPRRDAVYVLSGGGGGDQWASAEGGEGGMRLWEVGLFAALEEEAVAAASAAVVESTEPGRRAKP
jgi:hypothetical protein